MLPLQAWTKQFDFTHGEYFDYFVLDNLPISEHQARMLAKHKHSTAFYEKMLPLSDNKELEALLDHAVFHRFVFGDLLDPCKNIKVDYDELNMRGKVATFLIQNRMEKLSIAKRLVEGKQNVEEMSRKQLVKLVCLHLDTCHLVERVMVVCAPQFIRFVGGVEYELWAGFQQVFQGHLIWDLALDWLDVKRVVQRAMESASGNVVECINAFTAQPVNGKQQRNNNTWQHAVFALPQYEDYIDALHRAWLITHDFGVLTSALQDWLAGGLQLRTTLGTAALMDLLQSDAVPAPNSIKSQVTIKLQQQFKLYVYGMGSLQSIFTGTATKWTPRTSYVEYFKLENSTLRNEVNLALLLQDFEHLSRNLAQYRIAERAELWVQRF